MTGPKSGMADVATDLFAVRGGRYRNGNKPSSIADRIHITDDCWIWQGQINARGYGKVSVRGHTVAIHRVIWESLVGPIPTSYTLDHLCMTRSCVNPDHLEPVTIGENLRRSPNTLNGQNIRKTHCSKGHPFSGDNLIMRHGKRSCNACGK